MESIDYNKYVWTEQNFKFIIPGFEQLKDKLEKESRDTLLEIKPVINEEDKQIEIEFNTLETRNTHVYNSLLKLNNNLKYVEVDINLNRRDLWV